MKSSEIKTVNVQASRGTRTRKETLTTLPTRSSTDQSSEVKQDILSLSKAGTMQLRTIARTIHVTNYSKLKRQELIFAIIAKKEEFIKGSQMELFQ